MIRFLYLHGFASGPSSEKARWMQKKFQEKGRRLEIPALVCCGFREMTLGHQLKTISYSQQYEKKHSGVRLISYPSDHSLRNVLDPMWDEMTAFLEF